MSHAHGHSHGHDHHHHGIGHSHAPTNFGRTFAIATALNIALVAAQVIYGLRPIRWRCSPTPGTISATSWAW